MASITIKNIPEPLYARLKVQAKLHHRSINGEVIHCLEQMLLPRKLTAEEKLALVRSARVHIDSELLADPDKLKAAYREGLE